MPDIFYFEEEKRPWWQIPIKGTDESYIVPFSRINFIELNLENEFRFLLLS